MPQNPIADYEGNCLSAVRDCHRSLSPRRNEGFIGPQPKELERQTLGTRSLLNFHVTEKKDGERVLLTRLQSAGLTEGAVLWAVTFRNNRTQICWTSEGPGAVRDPIVTDIFDGEKCATASSEEGRADTVADRRAMSGTPDVLWVFDALMLSSRPVVSLSFSTRRALVGDRLGHLAEQTRSLPAGFGITTNPAWLLRDLSADDVLGLGIGWEGLIFYRSDGAYFDRRDAVLRWKHPCHLTADLLVEEQSDGAEGRQYWALSAWTGGHSHQRLALLQPPDGQARNSIAEFAVDEAGDWTFRRWRPDKMRANHVKKVDDIKAQAQSPIHLSQIHQAICSQKLLVAI